MYHFSRKIANNQLQILNMYINIEQEQWRLCNIFS